MIVTGRRTARGITVLSLSPDTAVVEWHPKGLDEVVLDDPALSHAEAVTGWRRLDPDAIPDWTPIVDSGTYCGDLVTPDGALVRVDVDAHAGAAWGRWSLRLTRLHPTT